MYFLSTCIILVCQACSCDGGQNKEKQRFDGGGGGGAVAPVVVAEARLDVVPVDVQLFEAALRYLLAPGVLGQRTVSFAFALGIQMCTLVPKLGKCPLLGTRFVF